MVVGLAHVNGTLFSSQWHRVARLRPRLRATVTVERHVHRGEKWYQLADGATGRRHRLNEAAYRYAGRLDGNLTAGELWDALATESGDAILTQDEAIRVMGQLSNAGLIQSEMTPDVERLFRQQREHTRRRRWMDVNPLAVRVRLFDPTRLLTVFDHWLTTLFSVPALLLWLVVVLPAVAIALHQWRELTAFATAHADIPRYWLIAWFAYPLIKAVHELAHALALRRWGGDVRDVGFTLFVLVPAPYVDASAAAGFAKRSQRAVVSAVGIMVELFIAALALFVWLNVQPGWVHDIAFVVTVIAAVSTVLFNGNPLLRFDGYHLLCDAFDLPNLDSRSRAWWRGWIQRALFRVPAPGLPVAPGEAKWLFAYAPLAWLYRLYLGVQIALWVGVKSVLLGIVVAAALLAMMIIMPLRALLRGLLQSAPGAQRQRALRIAWVLGVAASVLLLFVPLPYGALAPAVVWLPEQAEVRAQTDGMVRELKVRDGEAVQPGQVLALLDDPELAAKQAEATNRLSALRAQYFNALRFDRVQTQQFTQALAHAENELAHVDARIAQLQVRSEVAGRMVLAREQDVPGMYLKRGQMLGHVFAPDAVVVRAVVAEGDATLVQSRARAAAVWLEAEPRQRFTGAVRREVPAAAFKLPGAALSERNGGPVVTDPADSEHLRTLQPIFTVDVALAAQSLERIGGRAWVRFDFGAEPLAFQWGRAAGQLLLKHWEKAV